MKKKIGKRRGRGKLPPSCRDCKYGRDVYVFGVRFLFMQCAHPAYTLDGGIGECNVNRYFSASDWNPCGREREREGLLFEKKPERQKKRSILYKLIEFLRVKKGL